MATTLAPSGRSVIPLENGDRLPRAEFERRYLASPNLKKVELIEGVVRMPSPVRAVHAQKHGDLLDTAEHAGFVGRLNAAGPR